LRAKKENRNRKPQRRPKELKRVAANRNPPKLKELLRQMEVDLKRAVKLKRALSQLFQSYPSQKIYSN